MKTIKHYSCLIHLQSAQWNILHPFLFFMWNVSRCTLKHNILMCLLRGVEQKAKTVSSVQKNLTFWYLALLSQCSLHWCSQVIRKGDTLYMHSTIQNCSQSALVILQMHRFETSEDDKNNLISLAALQKTRNLLAILVASWLIHSGALR